VLPADARTEATMEWVKELADQKQVSVDEVEKDFFKKSRPLSLIRRFVDPSEVAALVAYVASPLSAVTIGAALRAEGGIVHSIG
jgi:NAD(P)-dependent dehydrogenase (short-subunit alcohol dehydrogenase family)